MIREIKYKARCIADGIEQDITFEIKGFDNEIALWPLPDEINHIDEYLSPFRQYTGFKDKNGDGKEIYEDDYFETQHGKGIVKMIDGCRMVSFGGADYDYPLCNFIKNDPTRETSGNIHHNL